MTRRRWPDGAEDQRKAAVAAIKEARELIKKARLFPKTNPDLLQMLLADALTELSDAERYLIQARSGEKDE